jgi:type IV fimbrial biogenesis protein FimT
MLFYTAEAIKDTMNRKNKNQAGFTLIELMITVAVAVILLGVGIPLFDSMMANNRAITQTNMFVTAFNLAKSEAVSKNITSTICADADGDPATFVCGNQNNWANGWFVFNDQDGDGTRDANDTVIKIWEALPATANIVATVGSVSFNSLGEKTNTTVLNFQLAEVDSSSNLSMSSQPRCIYLNAIGQLRTGRAETSGGDPLKIGDAVSDAVCP